MQAKTESLNVLGQPLVPCGQDPVTGFYRDGCCRVGPEDLGIHAVCAEMTAEFLAFSKDAGNDLSTPKPGAKFPGLKPGDRWCLCLGRWVEALEATRTEAKNLFRDISEGQAVPLTRVRMEDDSEVRFEVALDHSQYRGRLNFGAFRAGLTLLVANIADALREERPVKTFHAEHDANVVIFGISAVTVEEGEPSVLVLGADAGSGQPTVVLQLLYLDHAQFAEQAGTETSDNG